MDLVDPEGYTECPYDKGHVIRNKRMQPHIQVCRKNHPHLPVVKCPFNAAHVIPEVERRYHLLLCSDRHQIHGKIVTDLVEDPQNSGCVETPVYRPVVTHGEVWEGEEDEEPEEPPKQVRKAAFIIPEEEFEGLTPRERRLKYLKALNEHKAGLLNPGRNNTVPGQAAQATGSKSLALLQKQREATCKSSNDMYTEALQEPRGNSAAIGRAMGRASLRQTAAIRPGRGANTNVYANTNGHQAPPLPSQPYVPGGRGIGVGRGAGRMFPQGPVECASDAGDAHSYFSQQQAAGFSSNNAVVTTPTASTTIGVDPGRVSGMTAIGRGGMRAETAQPSPAVRGGAQLYNTAPSASPSPSTSFTSPLPPPGRMQPPGRGSMALMGTGAGLGYPAANPQLKPAKGPQRTEERASEDREQFVDAVSAWEEVQQCSPVPSSSDRSMCSPPPAVGSWAAHMDQSELEEVKAAQLPSTSEPASDSDYQDAETGKDMEMVEAQLRKVNKKLRQIRDLEKKKERGRQLDEDQEEKLRKKQEYEEEAFRLQQLLKRNN